MGKTQSDDYVLLSATSSIPRGSSSLFSYPGEVCFLSQTWRGSQTRGRFEHGGEGCPNRFTSRRKRALESRIGENANESIIVLLLADSIGKLSGCHCHQSQDSENSDCQTS